MTSPKKPDTKTSKLSVNKSTVKDLAVKKDKAKDVVGGGGGSPSKPRTANDYTCVPC